MTNTRNGKYLETGAKIAALVHELSCLGAYQAMRKVMEAADIFHEDVAYIESKKP